MTPKQVHKSLMQRGIVTLSVCVVASALLAGGSWLTLNERQNDLVKAEQSLRGAQARHDKAERAQRVVQNDLPRFRELERQGVIGTEQRLAWLQTLVQIGEQLRLPAMQYRVDAQEPFTPDYINFGGNYEVRHSDMTVSLQGFHEMDLLNVIGTMEQRAPGLFQVAECEALRLQQGLQLDTELPNVSAECRLRWFTISQNNLAAPPG